MNITINKIVSGEGLQILYRVEVMGNSFFGSVSVEEDFDPNHDEDYYKQIVRDQLGVDYPEKALADKIKSDLNRHEFRDGQWVSASVAVEWKVGIDLDAGKMVLFEDKLYWVVQPHTTQEDWTPDITPSLFSHFELSEGDEGVQVWSPPTGSHDAPNTGDLRSHFNVVWVSQIDGNTTEPGTDSRWWIPYVEEEDDEYPQWVQPTGAHDAYSQGDTVTHNDEVWQSDVNGNVWEPPTQWSKVD